MESQTPLPRGQFAILLAARFCGPLSFTILFPFVYFMVRDFKLSDDEKVIGFYAGLITSFAAFSQCATSLFWGIMSDKFGRRPVINFGLLSTAVTIILFGFSKSLTWALASRVASGLLAGNNVVIKTMVAELTDSSNRASGFTYLSLSVGMGTLIGPILGGFLSNPAAKYPHLFGKVTLLVEYPYLLPCAVSGVMSLAVFVLGLLFLEETLEVSSQSEETQGLIASGQIESPAYSCHVGEVAEPDTAIPEQSRWVIFAFMMLCLQFVMVDEIFPIWAATSIYLGGLSFTSNNIGTVLSIGGGALMVLQLVVYPYAQKRMGTITLFRNGFIACGIVNAMFPIAAFLFASSGHTTLLWAALIPIYCAKMGCRVALYTSSNILLAETCPNKKILGKVNGVSQSLASLMRGIGPLFAGSMLTLALKAEEVFPRVPHALMAGVPWFLIALFSISCSLTTNKIEATAP